MTGPDEGGLAARGHLRAAQADREQAITVLKAAYAQGRLTKDELEARAGQAFASRTYAELAALTAVTSCLQRRLCTVISGTSRSWTRRLDLRRGRITVGRRTPDGGYFGTR